MAKPTTPTRLRLPARFYVDHLERALPTPEDLTNAKAYVTVAADDPALPELVGDAEYYAHPHGPRTNGDGYRTGPCPVHLAAKALLAALARQGAYDPKTGAMLVGPCASPL